MNCENCQHGGTIVPKPKIKVVQGNVLRLAIPLTLRTIMKDGDEIEYQDTDFIPSSEHPVLVVFGKGKTNIPVIATMDENLAIVEERGKLPVGTYDITVECFDEVGQPYRFKKDMAVQVVDTTAEAGIEETIEYEAQTWYLDSAIYLATTEIGSLSEEIDQRISDLFGETEFDANNKVIRFYNKDGSKVLVTVDATPFVADGMVENVYIDVERQVLVVVLNADAGSRMFTVPLYLIFANYYRKNEVDARIAAAVEDIDTSDFMTKSTYTYPIDQLNPRIAGKIQYWAIPDQVVDYIDGIGDAHIATTGTIYGAANGSVYMAKRSGEQLLYSAEDRVIFNKEDGHLYTYDGEAWAQVSGSSSGGEGTVTGVRMNGTTHEPTDGVVDLGTVITQHQDISGKANSADLATVATSGSYNDLSNKPTIPAAQVQSDWNATSGMGVILNKPSIPSKTSDLTNDSGFTSNAGTITGITMNGASKGTSGVVNLGTVITSHQDISGKANASDVYTKTQTDTLLAGKQNTLTFDDAPTANSNNPVKSGGIKTYVDGKVSITGMTTSQDGTFTIAQSDGNSFTIDLNHTHPQYLKYVLLADEAAYTALATKDSGTLYLIPES